MTYKIINICAAHNILKNSNNRRTYLAGTGSMTVRESEGRIVRRRGDSAQRLRGRMPELRGG
jgi:hypothetical protein